MDKIRGGVINYVNCEHITDHLAVVAIMMNVPLLMIDPNYLNFAKEWYPEIDAQLMDLKNVNSAYYAENFDVLFQSEHRPKFFFRLLFKPYDKGRKIPIRNVCCPHGFSDKRFWFSQLVDEDITLVYGQNMLDRLADLGIKDQLGNYIRVGNYRYSYYKKHRDFLDKKLIDEVLGKFKGRKPRRTILYAPTFNDEEQTSSFFSAQEVMLEQLSENDHLILKLHPNIEKCNPKRVLPIIEKYQNKPNIVVLSKFPPVYPILAASDIYIGDMSSVGYDYLAFNRPMFFFNELRRDTQNDRGLFLYRCGTEIKPEDYPNIFNIIDKSIKDDQSRFHQIRQEVYQYTFGEERSFDTIREELFKVIEETNGR